MNVFADPPRTSAVNVYGSGKLAVFDCVVDAGTAKSADGEDVLQPQQPEIWDIGCATHSGAAVVKIGGSGGGACHFLAVIV
jgi:hypothetical protein